MSSFSQTLPVSSFFVVAITDISAAPRYQFVEVWQLPSGLWAQKQGGRYGDANNPGLPAPGVVFKVNDLALCRSADGNAGLTFELYPISSGGDARLVSPLTTKGDIWGFDTANNRIPVGADGTVLTADSTQDLGVKWGDSTTTSWKNPVRAATTTALPANTYNNFAAGDATLTGNSNGPLAAQDGVTLGTGNSLLVKNESTPANNGIYTLTQVGDASTPYILTRRSDANTGALLLEAAVAVEEGDVYHDTIWLGTADAPIIVGETALPWKILTFPLTTKGDLAGFDGNSNNRVPVGPDTSLLRADSNQPLGVSWGGLIYGSGGNSNGLNSIGQCPDNTWYPTSASGGPNGWAVTVTSPAGPTPPSSSLYLVIGSVTVSGYIINAASAKLYLRLYNFSSNQPLLSVSASEPQFLGVFSSIINGLTMTFVALTSLNVGDNIGFQLYRNNPIASGYTWGGAGMSNPYLTWLKVG